MELYRELSGYYHLVLDDKMQPLEDQGEWDVNGRCAMFFLQVK
jgi:hypothetical protein